MGYSIDGQNKLISLTTGTTSVSIRDLWSRWVDWYLTGDNSKFHPAFDFVGGNDIDAIAGTKIPVYLFLLNGWKVRPQESSHTLNVVDGIILVSGGGDPFINTIGSFVVRINYQQPVQAISFTLSGGSQPPSNGPTISEIESVTKKYSRQTVSAIERSPLLAKKSQLEVINDGVKKSSLNIPHKKNI